MPWSFCLFSDAPSLDHSNYVGKLRLLWHHQNISYACASSPMSCLRSPSFSHHQEDSETSYSMQTQIFDYFVFNIAFCIAPFRSLSAFSAILLSRLDSLTVETSCYTRVSLMLAEKASRYTNSNLLSKVLFPRVLHAIQHLTGFLKRRRSARQSLNSDPSIIFLSCFSFL